MEQSIDEVVVGPVSEVPPGTTKKFLLTVEGLPVEGFVVNVKGTLHAWVNRCRHVPMTMDWVDNRFLDEAREYIVCGTHGATYRPDTGECVGGPALGRALIRVPLRIDAGRVLVRTPAALCGGADGVET
jgi:nitrite reductase/ring-hydroxylating ferredoxin subunit